MSRDLESSSGGLLTMQVSTDDVDVPVMSPEARSVVRVLGLDPRLEPLIPLPTNSRRSRAAYQRAIDGIKDISSEPEPQRTRDIQQLFALVEHKRSP